MNPDPRARETALVELLRSIEWRWSDADQVAYCPSCGSERENGHQSWCRLAAALAASPAPGTGTPIRKLHMAFNVAIARLGRGITLPACDGPGCEVCRDPNLSTLVAGTGTPTLAALVLEVQEAHAALVAVRAQPHDARAVGDMAELRAAYDREDAAMAALLAAPAGTGTCGACRHWDPFEVSSRGTCFNRTAIAFGHNTRPHDGCRLGFSPRTEGR